MLPVTPHQLEILMPTYGTDSYDTPDSTPTYPDSGPTVPAFVQPKPSREVNTGSDRTVTSSLYLAYVNTLPDGFTSAARVRWNGLPFEVIGVRVWDAPNGSHTAIDLRHREG